MALLRPRRMVGEGLEVYFDERAGIAEFEGLPRAEAEALSL